MKVIFLDFDGVLNVIPKDWDQYGSLFHEELVENLRYIIQNTDAVIVCSSTWRLSGLQYIQDMWKHRGYPGDVIDITPFIKTERGFVDRGYEIQQWLSENQVENYVILDDDDDMLDEQWDNFVKCSGNITHPDCIDIGYGLTKRCTEQAIKILNNKQK